MRGAAGSQPPRVWEEAGGHSPDGGAQLVRGAQRLEDAVVLGPPLAGEGAGDACGGPGGPGGQDRAGGGPCSPRSPAAPGPPPSPVRV